MVLSLKKNSYFYLYFFITISCIKIVSVFGDCYGDNEEYIIRNDGPNGLVLDATDPSDMKAEYYTGYNTQLWKFKRASRAGLFYIINVHTNTALTLSTCPSSHKCTLKVGGSGNSVEQEWYVNSNGHICNAHNYQNLDIWNEDFSPNARIGTYEYRNQENQRFTLQLKQEFIKDKEEFKI